MDQHFRLLRNAPSAAEPIPFPGGGKKERAMRACVVVGLALAVACMAVAGEVTKERPNYGVGTFVSAEVAGELVRWQLDLGGDAGKKTFETSADVKVQYIEKDGVKQGQGIRGVGGKDFREREGAVVAKGKFASAKLDGEKVLVSIKLPEGDKSLEFVFPAKLIVFYRQEGEKLTALSITGGRPQAPKSDAK